MGYAVKLEIYYDSETDTLSLWNGHPASEADDVAEHLVADFDGEGEVVGFTLEHAAKLLVPAISSALTSPDLADSLVHLDNLSKASLGSQ